MAVKFEIRFDAKNDQVQQILHERVVTGAPAMVFDRGTRGHPSEITGFRYLPKERSEDVAFIDLTNSARRWYSLHVLESSTLAHDLSLLSRAIESWLSPKYERPQKPILCQYVGKIENKLSVLDFLVSLYFEQKPSIAEAALGGPEGIKAWRRFLRGLGQGLSNLIFEDPWFAFLFLGAGESVVSTNAPLVLVPLFRPIVPREVAMRMFEIILDRAMMLRTGDATEEDLFVFLSDAEDIWSEASNILSRLTAIYEQTVGNLNITLWRISTNDSQDSNSSELGQAIYTLSQLKYARDENIAKEDFKRKSLPKEIKNIDFFGLLHNLMYRLQESYSFSDKDELPPVLKALKKEGFLLGVTSPPIEFPDEL